MPQMGIQPEKEREGEGEKEREKERFDMGETSLSSDWPILYCLEKLFILLVVHRDQWIIQNYAVLAALTLIKTRLSLHIPSCVHKSQEIYIIFWPEGQLTFYGPFLIRVCQPEDLFVLFFPKSGATFRKLNKVTFLHIKDITIYNNERITVIYNKGKSN